MQVCCNWEPHLRGNVYVQFATEEEGSKAYTSFNGRWYAGKQLVCQYTPVNKWKGAICGKFVGPKGKRNGYFEEFVMGEKVVKSTRHSVGDDMQESNWCASIHH